METIDVVFESETATNWCMCDACCNVGQVIKLRLPSTRFHNKKSLTTRYYDYWLCPACRQKLHNALDWLKEED